MKIYLFTKSLSFLHAYTLHVSVWFLRNNSLLAGIHSF